MIEKGDSNRNKLYQLLINLDEKEVQSIYAKFFKELESSELDEFIKNFNVSKRNIKTY